MGRSVLHLLRIGQMGGIVVEDRILLNKIGL